MSDWQEGSKYYLWLYLAVFMGNYKSQLGACIKTNKHKTKLRIREYHFMNWRKQKHPNNWKKCLEDYISTKQ